MPKRPQIATLVVVATILTIAVACAEARKQVAARAADPSMILLDAQKACMLYELAPDSKRNPQADAMCARLRGDCGPNESEGAGGSP